MLCKYLFWLTPIHSVFIDKYTDYIWIYNEETKEPIYCFTGYAKIKKFFKF